MIGDGRNIRFWQDNWVNDKGRLIDIATGPVSNEQVTLCIDRFVTLGNQWNWDMFASILPN